MSDVMAANPQHYSMGGFSYGTLCNATASPVPPSQMGVCELFNQKIFSLRTQALPPLGRAPAGALKSRRNALWNISPALAEASTGFEPVDTGVADHCLTTWLRRRILMTPTGIEPVLPP